MVKNKEGSYGMGDTDRNKASADADELFPNNPRLRKAYIEADPTTRNRILAGFGRSQTSEDAKLASGMFALGLSKRVPTTNEKLTVEQIKNQRVLNKALDKGNKAQLINARLNQYNTFKPIIVGALVVLFVVGPGIAALTTILQSMNLWLWALLIIGIILIWRRS